VIPAAMMSGITILLLYIHHYSWYHNSSCSTYIITAGITIRPTLHTSLQLVSQFVLLYIHHCSWYHNSSCSTYIITAGITIRPLPAVMMYVEQDEL
jgi:hypothetical protein